MNYFQEEIIKITEIELLDSIIEATPDRCNSCPKIESYCNLIANEIISEVKSFEEGRDKIIKYISSCSIGLRVNKNNGQLHCGIDAPSAGLIKNSFKTSYRTVINMKPIDEYNPDNIF